MKNMDISAVSLFAGASMRDITPKNPAWLDGYWYRKEKSSGVMEPLSVGCLYLSDGKTNLMIICLDLMGMEHTICGKVFEMLQRKIGLSYPNVMISCSHTHFAPTMRNDGFAGVPGYFVNPDPEYLEFMMKMILESAKESIGRINPCTAEQARTQVPQVQFNRRTRNADGSVTTNFQYPLDTENLEFMPADNELSLMRFRNGSETLAVLANFACHPVVGYAARNVSREMVSSDYVHYFRETLGGKYKCPVFFTLGTGGDAVPVNRYGDNRSRIGGILGETAILLERQFKPVKHAKLAASSEKLEGRTRTHMDSGKLEKDFRDLMDKYGPRFLDPEKPDGTQIYGTPAWGPYADLLALTYQSRLYPGGIFEIPIQFIEIGGTRIVSLPFELLSEIGLRIKSEFHGSIIVSCANGYHGYLPLSHEFKRGGYETSVLSARFESETGDRALEHILKRLKAMELK